MGHGFSKTAAANNIAAKKTLKKEKASKTTKTYTSTENIAIPQVNQQNQQHHHQQFVGPTINLQIEESPIGCSVHQTADCGVGSVIATSTATGVLQQQQQQYNTNNSVSSSLTSVNNLSCGRQIIIKIQLAKMENGNEPSSSSSLSQHQQQDTTSFESTPAPDFNLKSTELATTVMAAGTQFLNLNLNNSTSNSTTNTIATTAAASAPSSSLSTTASLFKTGSSLNKNNNYLHSHRGEASHSAASRSTNNNNNNNNVMLTSTMNERPEHLNPLQFNDEIVEQNIGEIVEYCEVLEDHTHYPQLQAPNGNCNSIQMQSINEEPDNEPNICCSRKSKFIAGNGGSSMASSTNAGAKTKSRCRKCSCREAIRRFLDPSLSRSSNKASKQQKEQKRTKSQERHSINNPILLSTQQQQQSTSMHSTANVRTNVTSPSTAAAAIVMPSPAVSSQVSVWGTTTTTNGSDVIIPLTTPAPSQFVVVQCAIVNPPIAALHPLPSATTNSNPSLTNNSMISIAAQDFLPSPSSSSDLMVRVPSCSTRPSASAANIPSGPIVHSQVDFVHFLVPDLERITHSSFYWGKMDRYEAERLLEGKPEGTFLLRDSAQEEFLFSVTFRKYGRSLHARIEQSDHRFSFDCHDPCVFTAPTVTGLLEHYKDPSCVMFFEPMLTIPLHRKNCFSLQTLCRATIVSNTTYDGISELELPARLRSYLKEYHYKQKLRVKSNEPTYTMHCK